MRTWLAALMLIGCGGDPTVQCGAMGQACCMNNACTGGAVCMNNLCQPACGKTGQPCCVGSTCTDGSTCVSGTCGALCGALGQACCKTGAPCTGALVCMNSVCNAVLANTGDPCTKNADCGGTKPICITKDAQGVTWPGGYCTSSCTVGKNDPNTTVNPNCPGGNGTCSNSSCYSACTSMSGDNPCVRMGYSCFNANVRVCEPTAYSECDPGVKLSCPQDGGALIFVHDDGGEDGGEYLPTYRSCTKIGADPVGECRDGCDPMAPQSTGSPSPPCTASQGCYPNYTLGEGHCSTLVDMVDDGQPCVYVNQCLPGLSCHSEKNTSVCRHLCGGPQALPCPNGQTCVDLSATVPKTQIGICSG